MAKLSNKPTEIIWKEEPGAKKYLDPRGNSGPKYEDPRVTKSPRQTARERQRVYNLRKSILDRFEAERKAIRPNASSYLRGPGPSTGFTPSYGAMLQTKGGTGLEIPDALKPLAQQAERAKIMNTLYERGISGFDPETKAPIYGPSKAEDDYASVKKQPDYKKYAGQPVQAYTPGTTDRLSMYMDSKNKGINNTGDQMLNYMYQGGAPSLEYLDAVQAGIKGSWDYLCPEDLNIYHTLQATQGQAAADKYLDDMQIVLNRRQAEAEKTRWNEEFKDANAAERIAKSLLSSPANIVGGTAGFLEDFGRQLQGKSVNPYSRAGVGGRYTQNVRGNQAAVWDETFKGWKDPIFGFSAGDLYQAMMSALDSKLGSYMGTPAVSPYAYGVTMGMGAAKSEADRLYEMGAAEGQIQAGAAAAGIAEEFFEKFSVENLVHMSTPKNFFQVIGQGGVQGLIEASEEMATEGANLATNYAIMGQQSDLAQLARENGGDYGKTALAVGKQIGKAGLGGFFAGAPGGMVQSGGQLISDRHNTIATGKTINKADGGAGALMDQAENLSANASPEAQAEVKSALTEYKATMMDAQAGKRKRAKAAGKLFNATEKAVMDQGRADLAKSLARRDSKYTPQSAKETADAVFGYITGEEITAKQEKLAQKALRSDPAIQQQIDNTILNRKSNFGQSRATLEALVAAAKGGNIEQAEKIRRWIVDPKKEIKRALKEAEYQIQNEEDQFTFKNTDSGKPIYKGKSVDVEGVADIKDGQMTVKLSSGEIVPAKDVSFGSQDDAIVYSTISRVAPNATIANELLEDYWNARTSAEDFALGIRQAYSFGAINEPVDELLKAEYTSKLTPHQRATAYKAGKLFGIAQLIKAQTEISGKAKPAGYKGGVVTYDNVKTDRSKWSDVQTTGVETIEKLAQLMGVDFVIFESYKDMLGRRVFRDPTDGKVKAAPNGFYHNGTVYVDLNAGNLGQGTMLFTVAHELTHFIRDWSPAKFRVLSDVIMEAYGQQGKSVDDMIHDQMVKAKANGNELTRDEAWEEFIADSMETMLTDGNAVTTLKQIKEKDRSLWQKIKDWFKTFMADLQRMTDAYRNKAPDSPEGKFVAEADGLLQKLQPIYAEALADASDNLMNATFEVAGVTSEAMEQVEGTDGKSMFQYRAMEADEAEYREMLRQWGGMEDAEITQLFTTIDAAMKQITSNLEALDYGWENWSDDEDVRAFSPIKPNSDPLYKVSLDFSTLCRKRILQHTVQTILQESLNRSLTRDEGIAVRDALVKVQEEGKKVEVACALCYVEAARMKSPAQIKKFLNNREKIVKEFFAGKSGGDIKQKIKDAEQAQRQKMVDNGQMTLKTGEQGDINASLKSLTKEAADSIRDVKRTAKASYKPTAEERKLIDVAKGLSVTDFTSPEGLEMLSRDYPRLFDAYTSFIRNATKSKGIEKDTWWRAGDSQSISDHLIAAMNAENGLRSQSWSDFQVYHMLDYMAAVIELATRNAKLQTYTKVPNFVRLMGNTGAMINMSLIPARTWNGKLEYDDVEGFRYNESLALRDQFPETAGTICIGINNEQIIQLLADMAIDYVIPYHHSGMSAHVRKMMHIPNWMTYQDYQSEKALGRTEATAWAKERGVKLLPEDDPLYHKLPNFSDWFNIKEARAAESREMQSPSDQDKKKLYGVMYPGYMAMQAAQERYLNLCAERGLTPKFKHEKVDLTGEENYWKVLIDRKMVNNKTGFVIDQQALRPVFDQNTVLDILTQEEKIFQTIQQDQEYAIREVTSRYLNAVKKAKPSGKDIEKMEATQIAKLMGTPINNVTVAAIASDPKAEALAAEYAKGVKRKNSLRDSEYMAAVSSGNMEQAQKLVDEAAKDAGYNYKAFHGSPDFGFTIFNPAKSDDKLSLFFTDSPTIASSYTYEGKEYPQRIGVPFTAKDEYSRDEIKEMLDYHVSKFDSIVKSADIMYVDGKLADAFPKDKKAVMITYKDGIYETFTAGELAEKVNQSKGIRSKGSKVYGTYLKIHNPFVVEGGGKGWNQLTIETAEKKKLEKIQQQIADLKKRQEEIDKLYQEKYWDNEDEYPEVWDIPEKSDVFPEYDILDDKIYDLYMDEIDLKDDPAVRGEMDTRDVSEYAYKNGYDGVIFKDIKDHGGRSNFSKKPASTVYIVFDGNQVKSADPITYDNTGNVIPLSERFQDTQKDIRYSLRPVDSVQPTSDKWSRTVDTEEAKHRFPSLWDVTADVSEVRNPTQISSTVKSYRKIYSYLEKEGFAGKILDASSGLGYGTRAGIEEYGFNVEDIEPYPGKDYSPKYRDYSALNQKYDVIISNAVLNVLPQDQRDALVIKMGELLKDGGRIFINTRSKDVNNLANNADNVNISPMEWYVASTGSYQKGFTKKELTAYIQDALGAGFTVEPTNLFGAASVIVTKKPSGEKAKYSQRDPLTERQQAALEQQNEKLQEDVKNLNELLKLQGKLTGGKVIDKKSIPAISRKLMKEYDAAGKREELDALLNNLYSYIASGEEITWEGVEEHAEKAAYWLEENRRKRLSGYGQQILDDIKGTRVSISESQRQEIMSYYGSMKEFRDRTNHLVIIDQKSSLSLDDWWKSMSAEDAYPSIFEEVSEAQEPVELADVTDRIYNMSQEYEDGADPLAEHNALISRIYDSYWDANALLTVADKKQVEINDLKGALGAAKETVKDQDKELRAVKKSSQKSEDKLRKDLQKQYNAEIRELQKRHKINMQLIEKAVKTQVKEMQAERKAAETKLRQEARAELEATAKHYQQSRKNAIESRNRTIAIHKIQKVVQKLSDLLLNPTKEKHIPSNLRKPVADMLQLLDMDYIGAQEKADSYRTKIEEQKGWIAKLEDRIAKVEADTSLTDEEKEEKTKRSRESAELAYDKIDQLERSITRIEERNVNLQQSLAELQIKYHEISEDSDPILQNTYDPILDAFIDRARSEIGDTPLYSMSLHQLESVYKMYRALQKTIGEANKAHSKAIRDNIETLGKNVINEIRQTGGVKAGSLKALDMLKRYGWQELKPVQFFKILGSPTFSTLFDEVRAGEDTFGRDIAEAQAFHQEIAKKYGADKWDLDKTYAFTDIEGKDFQLTLQQMMSIYAYMMRGEQAITHFTNGGIVLGPDTKHKKQIAGVNFDFRPNGSVAYRLDEGILIDIVDKMRSVSGVEGYVQDMQEYLSKNMAAKGNEVSRELYDLDLFGEDFYFPLKSAKDWMTRAATSEQMKSEGFQKIKNKGMTKETVPNAGNPVVLAGFDSVWADHVDEMSIYHSMTLPLEDFGKVYAYHSDYFDTQGTQGAVVAAIADAYGEEPNTYINDLIRQLNSGGVRQDPGASIISRGLSKFKKGAVMASASVVAQQYSAIFRAMAVIDPEFFVNATNFNPAAHAKLWEEIKQYAPVAIIKEMGGFDTGVGAGTRDYLLQTEKEGTQNKVKAFLTDSQYRDEVFGKAPGYMDEVGWITIWQAAKAETKAKTGLSGEDLNREAAKLFTKAATETQVYDSVLSRSGLMRSKDTGLQMATAFAAEPTTTANMMIDAFVQAKRGNKKALSRTTGAILISAVINAIFASMVYAARDDDEDETYNEKYLESFVGMMVDNLNPATYLPIARDIMSLLDGWDVERSDVAVYADLIKSVQGLWDERKGLDDRIANVAGSVSKVFGIPVHNILRDLGAVQNLIEGYKGPTTKTGLKVAAKTALPKYLGGDWTVKQGEQLYMAIQAGDKAHIDRITSSFIDEEDLLKDEAKAQEDAENRAANALKGALRQHYLDGDLTRPEVMEVFAFNTPSDYFNKNKWEVDKWDYEKEHGTAEGWTKYTKLDEAIDSGDWETAQTQIDSKVSGGLKPGDLVEHIGREYGEPYMDAAGAEKEAIRSKIIKSYEMLGLNKLDIDRKFQEWDFEAKYGYTWEDKKDVYFEGSITREELAAAMADHGSSNDDIHYWLSIYDFEFENKWNYRERGDLYAAGVIDRDTLYNALINFGKLSEQEAELQIEAYDWRKENPALGYVTPATVRDWHKYAEPKGIDKQLYADAKAVYNKSKSDPDPNRPGKYIRNSKYKKFVEGLAELPYTAEELDAVARVILGRRQWMVDRYKTW